MFGSGVVAQHVYNTLRVREAQTDALGTPPRIKNLRVAPQGMVLPLVLHYAENGNYSGVVGAGDDPSEETIRYVVRWICQGESDAPIRDAAKDGLAILAGDEASNETLVTQNGEDFRVTILAAGEWPLTSYVSQDQFYRELGFFLSADVFRA